MLEGKMADVPGCMACEATFPYPVVRKVVRGSRTPLSAEEAWAMLPLYVEAARELERAGVAAITANCGLIALMQKELAATVQRAGGDLGAAHGPRPPPSGRTAAGSAFSPSSPTPSASATTTPRAGAADDIPVALGGVGDQRVLEHVPAHQGGPHDLRVRLTADLLAVVRGMLAEHPDIGAFVSECTMLPACLQAVREEVGLPVYDILTQLDLAMSGSFRPADSRGGR